MHQAPLPFVLDDNETYYKKRINEVWIASGQSGLAVFIDGKTLPLLVTPTDDKICESMQQKRKNGHWRIYNSVEYLRLFLFRKRSTIFPKTSIADVRLGSKYPSYEIDVLTLIRLDFSEGSFFWGVNSPPSYFKKN